MDRLEQQITRLLEALGMKNSLEDWLYAIGAALCAWFVLWAIRRVVLSRLEAFSKKTTNKIDDVAIAVLNKTKWYFYLTVSAYTGSYMLTLTSTVTDVLSKVVVVATLVQFGVWAHAAVYAAVDQWVNSGETPASQVTMAAAIQFVGDLLIWSVVLLLVLSNLGVEISALVAGLGVGGIAVALAAQNILGGLFASLSIFMDRPFDIGDFIVVGSMMGTVEKVGLRSTRVRALSGEELIFPNTDLVSSRIQNYRRMQERRIAFDLGVTYGTPYETLAKVPGILKEIITADDKLRFDRCHFKRYGDSALVFETVYYVLSADYAEFMDRQQALNFAVYKRFEEEGLEFAFPTQTVHVVNEAA